MENNFPYRGGSRFQVPNREGQITSPYDLDSRLLQDLAQRQVQVVDVITISLAVASGLAGASAQTYKNAGYGFVLYGHDGSAIKTVNTQAFVSVWINTLAKNSPVGFPAKHARGFWGPFVNLYLEWPAQASTYMDLIIFKSADRPWIDGESAT